MAGPEPTARAPRRRAVETRLKDLQATEALAARFAERATPGDVFALSGALGTGKTGFARAFIRARLGHPKLDVPSPTFTLVQYYDGPDGIPVIHADLYRIQDPSEVRELGLDETFGDAITLIEWPERLGPDLPMEAVELRFAYDGSEGQRRLALRFGDDWRLRVSQIVGAED